MKLIDEPLKMITIVIPPNNKKNVDMSITQIFVDKSRYDRVIFV